MSTQPGQTVRTVLIYDQTSNELHRRRSPRRARLEQAAGSRSGIRLLRKVPGLLCEEVPGCYRKHPSQQEVCGTRYQDPDSQRGEAGGRGGRCGMSRMIHETYTAPYQPQQTPKHNFIPAQWHSCCIWRLLALPRWLTMWSGVRISQWDVKTYLREQKREAARAKLNETEV